MRTSTINRNTQIIVKQEARHIFIGLAIVFIALITIRFTAGRTLDITVFDEKDFSSDAKVNVEFSNPDVCKVISAETSGNRISVTLEKISTGETLVSIESEGVRSLHTIKTNMLGLLTDNSSSNFSGWIESLTVCTLLLVYVTLVFLFFYYKSKKELRFSYVSIANLGMSIMSLIFSMFALFIICNLLIDKSSYTFGSVESMIRNGMLLYGIITSPIVIITAILLLVSNIILIRREGRRFANLLGIFLAMAIILGFIAGVIISFHPSIHYALSSIYFGIYNYFVCMIFAVLIIFIGINRHTPSFDQDCIIILGCAIRKDGTLYPLIRGRVDKAIEFAKKQEAVTGKKILFIPSGGQGSDEVMPEAEAMKNYLLEQGIAEELIRPETESTTTIENMRFSKRIAEEYKPGAKVIFSTTNYHVFRSGTIAGSMDWYIDGIGSSTKWYFWPNALIREIVGMIYNDRVGTTLLLGFIITVSLLATLV